MPSAETPSPDAAGEVQLRTTFATVEGTLAPDQAKGQRIGGAFLALAGAAIAVAGVIAVWRDEARDPASLLSGSGWALPAGIVGAMAASFGCLLLLRGLRQRCGRVRFLHAQPGILPGLDRGPVLPGPKASPGPTVEAGCRPLLLRQIDAGHETLAMSVLFAVVAVSGAGACWFLRPFAGWAGPAEDVALHAAIACVWLVAALAGWTWWRWKHLHRHAVGTNLIDAGEAIEVRIDGHVRPIARCVLAAVQLANAPGPTGFAGLLAGDSLQLILVVRLNDGLLERIPLAAQCGHRDSLALAAAALARDLAVPLLVPPVPGKS